MEWIDTADWVAPEDGFYWVANYSGDDIYIRQYRKGDDSNYWELIAGPIPKPDPHFPLPDGWKITADEESNDERNGEYAWYMAADKVGRDAAPYPFISVRASKRRTCKAILEAALKIMKENGE